MKEPTENMDKLYLDALLSYEVKPSKRFNFKLQLLLIFLRIKKLLIGIILLFGIISVLYFGNYLENDNLLISTNNNLATKTEVQKENLIVSDHDKSSKPIEANHQIPNTKKKEITTTFQSADKIVNHEVIYKDESGSISEIKLKKTKSLLNDNISDNIIFRKIKPNPQKKEEGKSPIIVEDTLSLKKSIFSLSFFASPSISLVALKAENSFDDYLDLRNENESPTISWSAGANVQIHIKKWFVQTGLNYTVYKNNKHYDYNYQILDSANSHFDYDTIWVWIYDPPNLEYPVMVGIDTVWVPVYEDINVKNNQPNKWSYLEIPILLGYQFSYGKFSIDVATGVSFGFLMESKGSLPKLPTGEGMQNLGDNTSKIMYNYLLQVGASYNINNDWGLIFQPYYKQNLNSVFEPSYPIQQRFKTFGFNLGIRLRL